MGEETTTEMPKYKCHKEVWALKIKSIDFDADEKKQFPSVKLILEFEEYGYGPLDLDFDYYMKHKPKPGGYYVVYQDGYKSFSPAEQFESGYERIK